jgi:hypothetical protein
MIDILIPILMWLSLPGALNEVISFPRRWLVWRRAQRFSSPAYDRWYHDIDTTTDVMAHDDWGTKTNKKGNKR